MGLRAGPGMSVHTIPATEASHLEELAKRAAADDAEATRALLSAIGPRVLGIARRLLGGSHPDLDDVAQESMIALVRGLPRFRGDCTILHYATRITIRTGLHHQRRQRARTRREQASKRDEGVPSTPADDALAKRRRRAVRELLNDLPKEQAEALALQCMAGLSLAEIAAATGVSPNTIRSRVRLAKERIQRKIEKNSHYRELLT